MSITKDFRYKVGVAWEGGRMTSVSSPEKPELSVATPPEFKNGVHGVWSPEDFLVAAAASCFTRPTGAGRARSRCRGSAPCPPPSTCCARSPRDAGRVAG